MSVRAHLKCRLTLAWAESMTVMWAAARTRLPNDKTRSKGKPHQTRCLRFEGSTTSFIRYLR